MSRLAEAIAASVNHHSTELILLTFTIPFLIGYWRTRDQLIGGVMVTLIGAAVGVATKRARAQTNVEKAETVNVDQPTE